MLGEFSACRWFEEFLCKVLLLFFLSSCSSWCSSCSWCCSSRGWRFVFVGKVGALDLKGEVRKKWSRCRCRALGDCIHTTSAPSLETISYYSTVHNGTVLYRYRLVDDFECLLCFLYGLSDEGWGIDDSCMMHEYDSFTVSSCVVFVVQNRQSVVFFEASGSVDSVPVPFPIYLIRYGWTDEKTIKIYTQQARKKRASKRVCTTNKHNEG